MNNDFLNRNEATDNFLQGVISIVYEGAIKAILSTLSDGPPGRKPREDLVRLSQWFKALDKEDQEQVQAVIRDAVDAAIFCFLVMLDNLTGGNPIQGQTSDFALYLQTYSDEEARKVDQSLVSVRINPAWSGEEDLHDMYRWKLEERQT
ncbi:MAG: hypothetical protein MN733_38940 [Nitrososphaera sp.]|nr:hypothetical protein [Nitrososphaera sp.]